MGIHWCGGCGGMNGGGFCNLPSKRCDKEFNKTLKKFNKILKNLSKENAAKAQTLFKRLMNAVTDCY